MVRFSTSHVPQTRYIIVRETNLHGYVPLTRIDQPVPVHHVQTQYLPNVKSSRVHVVVSGAITEWLVLFLFNI
jgi:hypothetical protein